MTIQHMTKLALTALLFTGALFATGCEKQPEEKAAEAIEEAGEALPEATN